MSNIKYQMTLDITKYNYVKYLKASNDVVYIQNYFTSSDPHRDISPHVVSDTSSDILSDTSSDILSGISSDSLFWHNCLTFFLTYLLTSFCDISSDILSGISSGVNTGVKNAGMITTVF